MKLSTSLQPHVQPGAALNTDAGYQVLIRAWRGEGSYARVFEARYTRTGSPCAVKVPKIEIEGASLRLERERSILAALRHPRIVGLLDSGCYDGAPYAVLEWLEGETLLDLVARRRRLALRQSLEILENVCEGLAHVHAGALSHGDIRPQNVIVIPARGAVLTDPGATGEQASPSGDVRATGALLHRMLTGEDPAPSGAALTPNAGYNRMAVDLWSRTQGAQPASAAELLSEIRRLRASI